MKLQILLMVVFLIILSGAAYSSESSDSASVYNAELAEKLGADDYGMKQYVMAFLKAGPNRSQDSLQAAKLQRAHLDNIHRLAEEGKLVLAGPFLDDSEIRGIYVFNVATIAETRELTQTDPAIQAGRLIMDLYTWYGSAALLKVNDWHKRLAKKSF
ncbi:MAG: YciI family protein [candidate division KSB1 bacterium]|nr:YciI family protein [candidate division KSB1 bacterium]